MNFAIYIYLCMYIKHNQTISSSYYLCNWSWRILHSHWIGLSIGIYSRFINSCNSTIITNTTGNKLWARVKYGTIYEVYRTMHRHTYREWVGEHALTEDAHTVPHPSIPLFYETFIKQLFPYCSLFYIHKKRFVVKNIVGSRRKS